MQSYVYYGPVKEFDRVITNRWKGETFAKSIGKARSNLEYQFKTSHGKLPNSKITFTGKICKKEENHE